MQKKKERKLGHHKKLAHSPRIIRHARSTYYRGETKACLCHTITELYVLRGICCQHALWHGVRCSPFHFGHNYIIIRTVRQPFQKYWLVWKHNSWLIQNYLVLSCLFEIRRATAQATRTRPRHTNNTTQLLLLLLWYIHVLSINKAATAKFELIPMLYYISVDLHPKKQLLLSPIEQKLWGDPICAAPDYIILEQKNKKQTRHRASSGKCATLQPIAQDVTDTPSGEFST